MAKEFRTLGEVVLEYPITVIDTSAFLCPMEGRPEKGDKSYGAEVLRSQMISDSAIFYGEVLERGGRFYITPKVLKEYIPGNYVLRKQRELDEKGGLPHGEFELFEVRQRENEERGKLIKMLESGGFILQLSDEEQDECNFFKKKYAYFIPKVKIGEVDLDFLISGAVVSSTRRPHICLVSNDYKILYSWKDFMKREKGDPGKFGFFTRLGFDVFERANSPYQ